MESPADLKKLFQKYLDGQATGEELDILLDHFKLEGHESPLRQMILDELEKEPTQSNSPVIRGITDRVEKRLLHAIEEQEPYPFQPKKKASFAWIAAAASLLLFLSVGGYFLLHKKPAQQTAQNQPHDVAPGRNQATLTLADGRKIILTKGLSGQLAQQGGTLVQVNKGNAIAYVVPASANTNNSEIQYNTLTTARGEQSPYPLVLADGTKVWLDAASSITFPTAFDGKERIVKITGEAYFEVAHNALRPFKVSVKGQTIEDVGTAFNINAYDDEPVVKTSLVSGKVKVYGSAPELIKKAVVLKPGQQASFNNNSISVENVDTDDALAWQHGYFQFNTDDLESAMRKIARWYDVDIAYSNDKLKNQPLAGTISRYSTVMQVLRKMELTGRFHFKLNGRKIIVE